MLLATKAAQAKQKGWERTILDTLPSSDLEMEAFLRFTIEPQNKSFEPLFREYYGRSFEAVKAWPVKLHSIFQIATEFGTKNWPDYDDIDWFCDELANVKRRDPRHFEVAPRAERPNVRTYLEGCGRSLEPKNSSGAR